jgi:hypothetical protein
LLEVAADWAVPIRFCTACASRSMRSVTPRLRASP